MNRPASNRSWPARFAAGAIAALAYLAPLLSGAHTLNADTKLGLTLNPGRLLSDARLTWDGHQFAGWVPHQTVSYLWPSGPFYWVADRVGLPDWVTQRLWISTLLCAAGLGVLWLLRRLGLGVSAALAGAAVYMLSPYVLAYLSRTSVMLLPWAGLPWIVGFTARAGQQRSWRWPAAVALVVATVGAVNATALAMIIPGPVLWLVCAAWSGQITWRSAARAAARIGMLCTAVSAWWVVAVATQSRHGADVLRYSETLDAVSLTATSTETMRGLGYWLFYVRDPYAMTTSAARPYMMSGRLIATGYLLLVGAIVGLALSRWAYRRFAALLIVVGVVIGVGVHPIDNAPPLTSLLSGSWLSLAVRSSSRAVPLLLLGMAIGLALLVERAADVHVPSRGVVRPRVVSAGMCALVVGAAVANLPALFDGGVVDPALAHGEPPPAWHDALADLGDSAGRVLQLPGAEFGAFDWGYTVDQPLLSLTDKPLVTRDLLPLGSAAAMDLLYAFDDRIQAGTLDPRAIAPVARLLGADRVWSANDIDSDRFRTPRPWMTSTSLDRAPGLTKIGAYGEIETRPTRFVDERDLLPHPSVVPRVGLYAVDGATTVRGAAHSVVVAGNGDGLVDAAAAGLIDGTQAVLYAAALPNPLPVKPTEVILTDSNRARAQQWRSSQDTTGFTETGTADGGLTAADPADARLPVFPGQFSADQTTARLDGPISVRASDYGEPFAYRPEARPAMAVDGDPSTAWVVADRGDPVGQSIELSGSDGQLRLLQAQDPAADRFIAEVRASWPGGSRLIALDETSRSAPGQAVELPNADLRLTITKVVGVGGDVGRSAVGFAEILPVGVAEVVTLPRFPVGIDPSTPVSVVVTRLRHDAADRWRTDPEPVLRRRFELPSAAAVETAVTIRLSERAADATVAAVVGGAPAIASGRMAGPVSVRGAAAVDGDPTSMWVTPFGPTVGQALTIATMPTAIGSFTLVQPADPLHSLITKLSIEHDGQSLDLDVPAPDPAGRSVITLPTPTTTTSLTVRIAAVEERWTGERRYGEVIQLPAAITEIDGLPLASPAAATVRGCRTDLLKINDSPIGLEITDEVAGQLGAGHAVQVTPCSGQFDRLPAGVTDLVSSPGTSTGIDIDQVSLVSSARTGRPRSGAPNVTMTGAGASRQLTVEPCPSGCWVVFGEGFASGWQARVRTATGSVVLGAPTLIDGGFNGWWLPPTDSASTLELRWPPQRHLDLALLVSAIAAAVCIVLLLARRHRPANLSEPLSAPATALPLPLRRAALAVAILVLFAALLIGWTAVLWCLPIGAAILITRRVRPLWWLAAALLVIHAGRLIWARRAGAWEPDAAWPIRSEHLHRPGLVIIAVLLVAALFDTSNDRLSRDPDATDHTVP